MVLQVHDKRNSAIQLAMQVLHNAWYLLVPQTRRTDSVLLTDGHYLPNSV